MPGNIDYAAPSGVFPQSLCTAFSEDGSYEQLQSGNYHDGTIQRSQLAQTSRRTFTQSKRLTSADLATLYAFWIAQCGGLIPFYFYNPEEPASGQQVGSNYDATGVSTQGRYTVRFNLTSWNQATDLCRSNLQGIALVEVE